MVLGVAVVWAVSVIIKKKLLFGSRSHKRSYAGFLHILVKGEVFVCVRACVCFIFTATARLY